MRQQLAGLASTLSELDDTEFSRKLRQQYTIFKKRYDDATGASARVRADNVFQVEDAMQQGRGELGRCATGGRSVTHRPAARGVSSTGRPRGECHG